jgi:hypothetical protein
LGKHLVLAFGGVSWGETALGVAIARELQRRGDVVVFVTHPACRPLLIGATFSVEFVKSDEDLRRTVSFGLDASNDLSSIVLADDRIAADVLDAAGIDPASFLESPAPVIAIDTWDRAITGDTIDLASGRRYEAATVPGAALRIVPIPLASPEGPGTRCRILPKGIRVADGDRDRCRASFGMNPRDRAVLVCTASFQAEERDSDAAVPELVSAYLSELGADVHVVHVGPTASALVRHLGNRYHWVRSLTPYRFDLLLGSVDLLLSLNISATTIGKAIASRLPTVVIQNTVEGFAQNDAAAGVPRFRVWPIGFVDFLAPLLASNPYRDTFVTCELFDRQQVVDTCRSLLFEPANRAALRHRQDGYAKRLQLLPTPAEAMTSFLDGWSRDRRSDLVGKPIAQ